MLSNASVDAMSVLAMHLAKKGIALNAASNSVLKAAVDATQPGLMKTVSAVKSEMTIETSPEAEVTNAGSYADSEGVYIHDAKLKMIRGPLAEIIKANFALARNTVQPLIRRVYEAIDVNTEKQLQVASMPLTVLPIRPHAIWDNEMLLNDIAAFEMVPIEKVTNIPRGAMQPDDVIIGLMKSGNQDFDALVNDFIEQEGVSTIVETYKQLFTANIDRSLSMVTPTIFNDSSESAASTNLIILLLARGLKLNPPEGFRLTETEFSTLLTKIIQQVSRSLSRMLKNRMDDVKLNNLRIRYARLPDDISTLVEPVNITVFGPTYMAWLNKGGSPEVLLGAAISTREVNANILLENKDYFIKKWNTFTAANTRLIEEELYNYRCASIKQEVRAIITEGEYNSDIPKETMYEKLDELYRNTPRAIRKMPLVTARRLVCRTFFEKTSAEVILTEQEEAMKKNPDLNAREAALVAAEAVITDYLGAQLTIVRE